MGERKEVSLGWDRVYFVVLTFSLSVSDGLFFDFVF